MLRQNRVGKNDQASSPKRTTLVSRLFPPKKNIVKELLTSSAFALLACLNIACLIKLKQLPLDKIFTTNLDRYMDPALLLKMGYFPFCCLLILLKKLKVTQVNLRCKLVTRLAGWIRVLRPLT